MTKLLDSVFSTRDGKQNRHIGELVKHREVLFCKVAYSKFDVPSDNDKVKYYGTNEGIGQNLH